MNTPCFLVTNDDGVAAPGLRALANALSPLGEVWVVAPDRERSATSHAITLNAPLRVERLSLREFCLDGTPADCVYLAIHHLLERKPSLIISGINAGPNLGTDVLYSGTVGAAMEAHLYGFPAMAVSLCLDYSSPDALSLATDLKFFENAANLAAKLAAAILHLTDPTKALLNVNIPCVPPERIIGLKVCRLGFTDWTGKVSVRTDPRGRTYYWIGGERSWRTSMPDSDYAAIAANYVAVSPLQHDLTSHSALDWARGLKTDIFL